MTGSNTCPGCGYGNPLGANFCMSCGVELGPDVGEYTTAAVDPATEAASPASGAGSQAGVLVVRQGPKRGSRISLDAQQVTIGRHPESDIFLDDITVSRRHAEIHRTSSGFDVVDVGSLNGTYINRTLIERAPLTDGDELQVGKFKLVYLALEEA